MNDVRRADSSMGGTVMDSSVIPTLSVARIACVAFQKKKKKNRFPWLHRYNLENQFNSTQNLLQISFQSSF